jgi:hypothetical protein
MRRTPRARRIVIDNDGMYNDLVRVGGDYNHPAEEDSRARTELYDRITDKIYQPTYHPRRPNVGTYLFHGYDPAGEVPLEFSAKEFGMFYVGSNWFRWRAMQRVLRAVEPVRARVGRIGIAGHNWAEPPAGAEPPLREDAYATDLSYLQKLGVELFPSVRIDQVIPTMSRATFNPVMARPTFNHLRLVNPRLFETPAANTIPLFDLDREYVREVFGERAVDLVLGERPTELIADVVRRPEGYVDVVEEIRRHLGERHSYEVRLRELIDIAKS